MRATGSDKQCLLVVQRVILMRNAHTFIFLLCHRESLLAHRATMKFHDDVVCEKAYNFSVVSFSKNKRSSEASGRVPGSSPRNAALWAYAPYI